MAEREVKISFTGDAALFKGAGADVRKVFNDLMADADDASLAGSHQAVWWHTRTTPLWRDAHAPTEERPRTLEAYRATD